MSVRENIRRYYLIINRLRRDDATFKEIDDYLRQESELQGIDLRKSKRTIQRDIEVINSIFGLNIHFDFKRGIYKLDYDDEHSEKNNRMVEALDLFNALKVSENISGSIHFEKRSLRGTENLNGLLHAIQNSVFVRFQYNPFTHEKTIIRNVQPYALKEFRYRWYLIAHDTDDNHTKVYALDRLTNLEITQRKFRIPSDFSIDNLFKNSFGIINTNGINPEIVIISMTPAQFKYFNTLPLHHSQEVILKSDNEIRIKLLLVITPDFIMELLSYGTKIKIIEPKELIDEIRRSLLSSLEQYSDNIN